MTNLSSKLKLTKERQSASPLIERDLHVTQYENSIYTVSVHEDGKNGYVRANVKNKNIVYPSIYDNGVYIPLMGALNEEELNTFLDRVAFAKDTFNQVRDIVEAIKNNTGNGAIQYV